MIILSMDTSCDETAVAVVENTKILSNIIWSQASIHAKFGGVYPSLAQRMHQERIDWVVKRAIKTSKLDIDNLDFIAVTIGPGLAPALEVGINKAKELAIKLKKPLVSINHIEAHLLSPLITANNKQKTKHILKSVFPAFALVVSGGTTQLIYAQKVGYYKILAQTMDDALGEALDKGARLLGLGYPGGAVLEKFAKEGDLSIDPLPIPMLGREREGKFSYSGIKTALSRKVIDIKNKKGSLTKTDIHNLALSYQNSAFTHLVRVTTSQIKNSNLKAKNLLIGGGVGANKELRKRIRKMCKELGIIPLFPYSNKLYGDNAAMIGVTAYLKIKNNNLKPKKIEQIERMPRYSIEKL